MKKIDINCDMGESYGRYVIGQDAEIMPFLSSCNIACGFHGGDPLTILKTIRMALQHGVGIGAHPSFQDLAGFGRRKMDVRDDELTAMVMYQVGAVKALVESEGGELQHVKPHGALYHYVFSQEPVFYLFCEAISSINPELIIVGPAMRGWETISAKAGIRFAPEIFTDRQYRGDYSLVSRSEPNAIIPTIEGRTRHILSILEKNTLHTVDGTLLPISGVTLCIHGDDPLALPTARALTGAIKSAEIQIAPIGKWFRHQK